MALQERQFDRLWATHDKKLATQLLLNVELTPERLAAVRQVDGITYAYICAKRGVVLSEEDARELWDKYATSYRAGLLLWCFGQMKLRGVLTTLDLSKAKRAKPSEETKVLHGA